MNNELGTPLLYSSPALEISAPQSDCRQAHPLIDLIKGRTLLLLSGTNLVVCRLRTINYSLFEIPTDLFMYCASYFKTNMIRLIIISFISHITQLHALTKSPLSLKY